MQPIKRLGLLTSGGDSPGMNAAIRAVVRTAIHFGLEVYAIHEGYKGMIAGGSAIQKLAWNAVSGILPKGGTIIGTARSQDFQQSFAKRLMAAQNLINHEINGLVVIGGDGSLTGANLLRTEWPSYLAQLVEQGAISPEKAAACASLSLVGLVGSIDNDMEGTDITIGADTALHRITEAIDAISSTAASHQRTFVVEVMGRHCGYLALMSAIATAADWVFIPEDPPGENWEAEMGAVLREGRDAGRRDTIVILAEKMFDRQGQPLTVERVCKALAAQLDPETEVRPTVLGYVQRGGSPSAFDRNMSTLVGHEAVKTLLAATPETEAQLIGMHNNEVVALPLMACVQQTAAVASALKQQAYAEGLALRGSGFSQSYELMKTLVRAEASRPKAQTDSAPVRLAVLNAGSPAPGMNTATRAAVRLALDKGHLMLGIEDGFQGFVEGHVKELGWMDVSGWASLGGSELGTRHKVPTGSDLYAIARTIETHKIQGLLVIGGWAAYEAAATLFNKRADFPLFKIPLICLPATINNDLPGSELSIGTDTALNNIIQVIDKIKQSAIATRRCFIVEVMGYYCGYLALMSGLATGAERVYLHEEGITLKSLQDDILKLKHGLSQGKRLGLLIRNEKANHIYTTSFMRALFEEESEDAFDVRQAILGHLQEGGDPSPFDRIQATLLAAHCVDFLLEEIRKGTAGGAFIGYQKGEITFSDLKQFQELVELKYRRAKDQWWRKFSTIAQILDQPAP